MAPQRQHVRVSPKTPEQNGESMRQRHYRARVWLNEKEYNQFVRNLEKTGLNKETYLRQLIMGYTPKHIPKEELIHIIHQLMLISKNARSIECTVQSDIEKLVKSINSVIIKIQSY